MKQLGPYRKFVIAAAIVQSIIVIVAGFLLFKDKLSNMHRDTTPASPQVEQPAATRNQ